MKKATDEEEAARVAALKKAQEAKKNKQKEEESMAEAAAAAAAAAATEVEAGDRGVKPPAVRYYNIWLLEKAVVILAFASWLSIYEFHRFHPLQDTISPFKYGR